MPEVAFPDKISAHSRANFVHCETKFHYQKIRGVVPPVTPPDPFAGQCFAEALKATRIAHYLSGQDPDTAIRTGLARLKEVYGSYEMPPSKATKSLPRLQAAVWGYFNEYPLDDDVLTPITLNGNPAIEFQFEIDLDVDHPTNGKKLKYEGRCDMIGQTPQGKTWILDDKTTGRLGASWRSQWNLESALTGYVWAAHCFDLPVIGACVRGVGMYKTEIRCEQVFTLRPAWQILRWWQEVNNDARKMIECWRKDSYRLALTKEICSSYNGCSYVDVCQSQNPDEMLRQKYVKHSWEPAEEDGA